MKYQHEKKKIKLVHRHSYARDRDNELKSLGATLLNGRKFEMLFCKVLAVKNDSLNKKLIYGRARVVLSGIYPNFPVLGLKNRE